MMSATMRYVVLAVTEKSSWWGKVNLRSDSISGSQRLQFIKVLLCNSTEKMVCTFDVSFAKNVFQFSYIYCIVM
jgi:hypothetical protein